MNGPSTLRDYLRVVARRKWIVLQAVAIVPVAALLFSLHQQPLFQADAEVLLSHENLANSLNGIQDPTAYQQPDRIVQTQADVARVPTIARRVVASLGLRSMGAQELLDHSSVAAKTNADLLVFSVTDASRALAARLASEYAHQFTVYRHQLDTAALVRARDDVRARIDQLQASGDHSSPLYQSLVEKDQQLGTMEALQTSNAHVIRDASSAGQIAPRPVRNTILGLALGIVLGIGLALLWEALDTRVRSAEEIRDALELPSLGRIPAPPRKLRGRNKLLMLERPNAAHAEAFRVLRTNLDFANLERAARTIMVTSALEGEGKSTTIANLAVAMARSGDRRVALVDLDLRRPLIDRLFGLDGHAGLTDVALGRVGLDEAIARVPIRGETGDAHDGVFGTLEVLTSGLVPPDPGEFIRSRALAGILESLRDRADVVFVDTPPLLHVGDALALSAQVDGLFVVTRPDVLRRGTLGELCAALDSCLAAKLGFVVAGVDGGGAYTGYGYYASRRQRAQLA